MNARFLLAASLLLPVPAVLAQDAPAPPPPTAGAPAPAAPHAHNRPDAGDGRRNDQRGGRQGDERHGDDMRGTVGHLLPPGTWWRNPDVVTRLALSPDQTKRIEDLFTQSRVKLIDLHASLEKEQLMLEPLLNANPVDQGKALAEIGKIADVRAELEKTDAKMLLSIRSVLSADQWTKLRGPRGPIDHEGGPRGGGQQGQGAPGDRMHSEVAGPGSSPSGE